MEVCKEYEIGQMQGEEVKKKEIERMKKESKNVEMEQIEIGK